MSSRKRHETVTRDEAVQLLANALDEARYAQLRFDTRARVTGFHGEDYEQRWRRVQRIVTEHNDRAIRAAREQAVRVGWTETELVSPRLSDGQDRSNIT